MAPVKAFLEVINGGPKVTVHFNPQNLQLNYFVSGATGTVKPKKEGELQEITTQQTGYGATLSMDLLFDTSESGQDVRNTTLIIRGMIQPAATGNSATASVPSVPIVRFSWGTFLFSGTIQSMRETIDLFSEQGFPLRSTVSLSMNEVAQQMDPISSLAAGLNALTGGIPSGGDPVGTTPLTLSQGGDTLQSLVGRAVVGGIWKAIASANNIENPRLMQAGTILNLKPPKL